MVYGARTDSDTDDFPPFIIKQMLEDLERIRILEGRMRKKPTQEVRRPEDEEKSLNKLEVDKNLR